MSFLSMCKELELIFVDFINHNKIQSAKIERKKVETKTTTRILIKYDT